MESAANWNTLMRVATVHDQTGCGCFSEERRNAACASHTLSGLVEFNPHPNLSRGESTVDFFEKHTLLKQRMNSLFEH